jgi:ferric-dicitrate binding protein FerR (iron transport regulator)
MNYSDFSIDDFLADNGFINWVLHQENDAFWQQFLRENPLKKNHIDKATALIQAAQQVGYPTLTPSVKAAMWAHINAHTAQVQKPVWLSGIWRLAAAIALLVVASATLFYYLKNKTPSVKEAKNALAKEVSTAYQQRKQVTLPDGSVVTLNAHSHLKVSDNWDDAHTREVWLDGEAFFEVVKKPNTGAAKFVVHTPQLNIEVLGTAFNVKARRGTTEVVLQSGKVRLKNDKNAAFKEIEMQPGDKVKINDDAPLPLITNKIETEKVTAWTNGKIIFDNTPLLEVAKSIEDHFGYKVTIEDVDLKSRLYTGELLTDTPDVFFNVLARTLNVKVDIEGKNMKISKK